MSLIKTLTASILLAGMVVAGVAAQQMPLNYPVYPVMSSNPWFGTVSADTISATTVSGSTYNGTQANFTNISATNITISNTAQFLNGMNVDAQNAGALLTGNSTTRRGLTINDNTTNVAKIHPTSSQGGLEFTCLINGSSCIFRTASSDATGRGIAVYAGNAASAGLFVSSGGFAAPAATLQVSGTSIIGKCNASMVCGAAQAGAACVSTVTNQFAICNGAGSWARTVSNTTLVSASAL